MSRNFIYILMFLLIATPAYAEGDATRGQKLFYTRCGNCHDLDVVRIGPPLRYVYGRQAGTGGQFDYSEPLSKSGRVWDEATLDLWLQNPSNLVQGQKMYFITNDPKDRADIIAYLKQLALHQK